MEFRGDPRVTATTVLNDIYAQAVTGHVASARLSPAVVRALSERGLGATWLADGLTVQTLETLQVFDMYGARRERVILYARAGDHRRQYSMTCVQGLWRVNWIWSRSEGRLGG